MLSKLNKLMFKISGHLTVWQYVVYVAIDVVVARIPELSPLMNTAGRYYF
jgi:hypothetical protein